MPTQRNSTNDILFLSCWPVIDMEFCNHTVNRRVKFVIWSLRYGSRSHFQRISGKFEFMEIFNDYIKLKYWNSSVLSLWHLVAFQMRIMIFFPINWYFPKGYIFQKVIFSNLYGFGCNFKQNCFNLFHIMNKLHRKTPSG